MKNALFIFLILYSITEVSSQENSLVYFSKSQATNAQLKVAEAAGYLSLVKEGYRCNGFLVTDNIIMTNAHCLNSSYYEPDDITITFNYGEIDAQTYNCGNLLYKNEELDLALLKVDGLPPGEIKKVIFANKRLTKEDVILVINYNYDNPDYEGNIYQIFAEGPVKHAEKTENPNIYYTALTQGGSSGSAVFNKNERDGRYYLVGLHNSGIGNIFEDGYKGGISADLIYDKIMSLDIVGIDDVEVQTSRSLSRREVTYHPNGRIKKVGNYFSPSYSDVKISGRGKISKLGKWNEYYEDGTLKSKEIYNIFTTWRSGEWVKYYSNGQISSRENYSKDPTMDQRFDNLIRNGVLNGYFYSYYKDGQLRSVGKYDGGEKIGVWNHYNRDGSFNYQLNFDDPRTLNKSSISEYYDEGYYSKCTGELLNSMREGVWECYFTKPMEIKKKGYKFDSKIYGGGKLIGLRTIYKNGKRLDKTLEKSLYYPKPYDKQLLYHFSLYTQKAKYFHRNGQLNYEMSIDDSFKTLSYINAFDKSGIQTLKDGNGYIESYHPNEELESKTNIKNGSRSDITIWYYNNGQEMQSAFYKNKKEDPNGLRWEVLSSFHKDGSPREKGSLKNGTGTWISYDIDGEIIEIISYKNGVKIE